MQTRKIKWGILGTAWISDVMAEAILSSDNAELVAVASRTASKVTEFAKKYNLPKYYHELQDFLSDPEIEAVYIGLPNHLHKDLMIQCAKAGKHILCEKPFVLNPAEAQEVMDVVQRENVFCMEALMYRCHPFIAQLQELIASDIIGEIKYINAVYTANIVDDANKTAGGAIRNLGCYPVSLMRLLVNEEPVNIISTGKLDESGVNDNMSTAIFTFESGVIASIATADNIDMHAQFTVLGTKGSLAVQGNPWLPDHDNQVIISIGKQRQETLHFKADKSLYTYQIEFASDQIKSGIMSPQEKGVTWAHSLGNVKVLDAWLTQIKNQSLVINDKISELRMARM